MNKFDVIIFDLGGVLLNIDFSKTQEAFEKLGMQNAQQHFGQYAQAGFFDDLDKGLIDEKQLYDEIRKLLPGQVTDEQLRNAWNSMILDFPPHRIKLLKKLRNTHRLFLLSNTNSIHYPFYNKLIQSMGEESLDSLFDYAYYSFNLGMRKPEAEIFQHVLDEQQLTPSKTIFIDDTLMHVQQAKKMGISVIHLIDGMDVSEIFSLSGL